MRSFVRSRRGQRGAALIEMMLVFPLFAMLIMGVVEFGHLLETFLIVDNAAREGARVAARGADDQTIRNRVSSYLTFSLQNRLTNGDVTFSSGWVTITRPDGVGNGRPVMVKVPTIVKTVTPLFGTTFPLGAGAEMRQE